MRVIQELIDKMYDVIDEVEYYASKAHHFRAEHKALADAYIKSAEAHIEIFRNLHDTVMKLIAEQKEKGKVPTPEMQTIYDHEHNRVIEEFHKAKWMVEEYKKTY